MDIALIILVMVGLLLLQGFFSASEIALVTDGALSCQKCGGALERDDLEARRCDQERAGTTLRRR